MNTEKEQETAAAKAGMDAKTARKYRRLGKLPSEMAVVRRGRTRPDPFVEVWGDVQKLYEDNAGLEAETVFEFLQRKDPGRFQDGQLRTLQRRVKVWRATEGPAREVFFAQQHPPGRLGASDFTHMEELGVTIRGQSFAHLLYHFVLPYSNWETGTVCFSESFESLSEGLQNALWRLGKVPERHRTDRLSTAVNNMSDPAEFTERYQGLLRFYGLEGEKTQANHGNENGDVEQRHHRFKRAVAQELMLRGSVDFASVDEYKSFLEALLERLNAGRRQWLAEELEGMKDLPERRMESSRLERVKVDSGSLIHVDRNAYSVPSRLIGEQVEARLFMDHVEVWYGQRKVAEMLRLRGRQKHRVDYRHIIDWLVRKPGAFEHYRYRGELFPTSRFRMSFDLLEAQLGRRRGSREYLKVLELAAKESEAGVDAVLRVLLTAGDEQISAKTIAVLLGADHGATVRDVEVAAVDLSIFDQLYSAAEVLQ
ncbi:MAG: IS21 family transposase [Acidobacteriaceae bacterium]